MRPKQLRGLVIGALAAAATAAPAIGTPTAATAAPAPGTPVAFNGTVNIVQEPTGPGPSGSFTNQGAWTASGAVAGSFTVSEQSFVGGGNSPTLHAVDTLTGSAGTITIDVQTKFTGASGPYAYFQGVWTITGGTGAYANLHGTGDETGTVYHPGTTHTLTESLSGFGNYATATAS